MRRAKEDLWSSFLFPTIFLIYVMKLEFLYSEIESFISRRSNRDIEIVGIKNQSIIVTVFGIDVTLINEGVVNNKVVFCYETNLFGKGLIKALTTTVNWIRIIDTNKIEVDISDVLSKGINITITDVRLESKSIIIEAVLS